MSNYTFFVQMCREEHRKKHPNENVNFTEFSKKCAERWKVTIPLFFHQYTTQYRIWEAHSLMNYFFPRFFPIFGQIWWGEYLQNSDMNFSELVYQNFP